MRSLSNDGGDGNENGKKAIGLLLRTENNNFTRAAHFFVYFLAVVERLRHETS